MIAIDTNILVRWITQDDPVQGKKVEILFKKHNTVEAILISEVVLVELEWVLSSVYGFNREQIADTLSRILRVRQFTFRNRENIAKAIEHYTGGERDFSDCMIGELGYELHAKTYTFDKALKRNSNYILIKK